jgi:hypothetical protein
VWCAEKASLDKLDQASEKFKRMCSSSAVDLLLALSSPAEEVHHSLIGACGQFCTWQALVSNLEHSHKVIQGKYDQVFATFQQK